MDLLLRQKYSYTIASSFDSFKMKLEKTLKKNWNGSINIEGVFTFTPAFNMFDIINYGHVVYLKGNFLNNNNKANINKTIVNITLSPNIVFVFILYLLPLVFLNICFGDNSIMGKENSRLNNFMVILIPELLIFAIIQIGSFLLRRKFEKAMINI